MSNNKIIFTRSEMLEFNRQTLLRRGVTLESIADIAYKQQKDTQKTLHLNYV